MAYDAQRPGKRDMIDDLNKLYRASSCQPGQPCSHFHKMEVVSHCSVLLFYDFYF